MRLPHSWGSIDMDVVLDLGMLCFMLKGIAPEKAGDEGWSVTVTAKACERALIREGRAAPVVVY